MASSISSWCFCFNPCFSGYGIQTWDMMVNMTALFSFNPCFSGYGIQTQGKTFVILLHIGFNPCFSGYGIQTLGVSPLRVEHLGFNPCFSGYGIQTRVDLLQAPAWKMFQSLFFWIWNSDHLYLLCSFCIIDVSILVFLDMEFRLAAKRVDTHVWI